MEKKLIYLTFFFFILQSANSFEHGRCRKYFNKNYLQECSTCPIIDHINKDNKYADQIIDEKYQILHQISQYMTDGKNILYILIIITGSCSFLLLLILQQKWRRVDLFLKKIREENEFSEAAMYGNDLIFPGDFVRPLSRVEYMLAVGGMRNSFCVHHAIWLRSKSPIDENVMKNALTLLTRQYPFLQLYIGIKYFGFWFKRMDKIKIDFTSTTNDAMTEFRNELSFTPHHFNGPLWRVTLVKCLAMTEQPYERNYKSVLIFRLAHVITDGFTNLLISREIIRFYNQLINGESIVLSPATFSLPLGSEYGSLSMWEIFKAVISDFLELLSQKSYVACICPERTVKHQTKVDFNELTEEETLKLLDLCKKEKITVNSFINTAAAIAYVQTAQKFSGSVLNNLDVSNTQLVNLRQFVKNESDKLVGSYISIFCTISKINLKEKSDFWKEARSMQEAIKSTFNDNYPMRHSAMYKYWCLPQVLAEGIRFIHWHVPNFTHFCTTNMCDISGKLSATGENDCVDIYDIFRTTAGPHLFFPFILTFHSFRKILKFSIAFSTSSIKEEAASYFLYRLIIIVKKLIRENTLPTTYNEL